jgi:hypothetical protein
MKRLGYFLASNTTNILALYFVGWAVWAGCNWESVTLVQKLVLVLFFLLVVHEYEEAYKERFWALMGQVVGVKPEELKVPGLIHVPADLLIVIFFTLALMFPDRMWLVFPTLILGIFEMFIHNWGIVMFRLKGVSPGWYTAMLQGIWSIYALVLINRNIDYDGIQWLWATLFYVGMFIVMELLTWKVTGKRIPEAMANFRAFAKQRFTKKQ